MTRRRKPLVERFWPKVTEDDTGCWPWIGAITGRGYGHIVDEAGKHVGAHRVAYQLLVGPIPAGLDLDHLCRVRTCVNPAHLEPVTRQVNLRRGAGRSMVTARTDRCYRGHLLTEDNTYRFPSANGYRRCRTCSLANSKAWNEAHLDRAH